ncbi:hypothetical protein KDW_20970 [Dictyobacter vulcani]|uniref:Uncharacterized protein n=1 Tax=Dictyobacter vulcani TaxID=2607529 RepID=A0A5J4KJG1_9CHLR|nr:hypothetical protein KDW_20970 [Dictyobacter vulcani]
MPESIRQANQTQSMPWIDTKEATNYEQKRDSEQTHKGAPSISVDTQALLSPHINLLHTRTFQQRTSCSISKRHVSQQL